MDAQPSRKAKKWVRKCVDANVCLCGCGLEPLKRGLAQNCYYAWYSARSSLGDAEKQAAYDSRLIREGRLLNAGEGRKLRNPTVFSKAAADV